MAAFAPLPCCSRCFGKCGLKVGAEVRQAQINLPANARAQPYHSLALPLSVYREAKDGQLSDLRIRNANGEL